MTRIAFYAPVKPPDHPIPSGDREISKLLMKAMEHAGHEVELASRYIAYQKRPGDELFATRKAGGQAEAEKLLERYRSMSPDERPQVWFTYHTYCKAPDHLGPAISEELGIPYVTAEACRTRQNSDADWQKGRDIVQDAIRHARLNFCLKPSDKDYLSSLLSTLETIVDLPPFVDESLILSGNRSPGASFFANDDPVIITVGMMREGKKFECYEILSNALRGLGHFNWNLTVVGEGPERAAVERLFSFVPSGHIHWAGLVDPQEVHRLMAGSDIFAWPGYREPIGMVYLEAQTVGLPVAAMASLGVPTVVKDRLTGLLSEELDINAYGRNIERLLNDADLRSRLGKAGKEHVQQHHGIDAAARLISTSLSQL